MKNTIYNKWIIIASFSLNFIILSLFSIWTWKHPTELLDKLFPSRTINIVMLGNSLTGEADWTKQLGRIDVHNSGKGGFITLQLLDDLRGLVFVYKPKICFIEGGINDIDLGVTTEDTFNNFKLMVDSLKANNIIPILSLTLYQHNTDKSKYKIDSLNVFVKKYALENKIDFFDLNEKLSQNHSLKAEYTTDGTHLTKTAYPFWADEIEKILKKYHTN